MYTTVALPNIVNFSLETHKLHRKKEESVENPAFCILKFYDFQDIITKRINYYTILLKFLYYRKTYASKGFQTSARRRELLFLTLFF